MSSAPGWYADPSDSSTTRYWDGTAWTEQRNWDGATWVTPAAAVVPDVTVTPAATVAPASSVAPVGTASSDSATPTGARGTTGTTGTTGTITAISFSSLPVMSVTSWLLFVGALLAAIGVFLPWEQDSTGTALFGSAYDGGTVTRGPTDAPILAFLIVALLGLIVWLGWPSRVGRLSKVRCVGISITVAALWALPLLKANAIGSARSTEAIQYGLGFGWFLTAAGLVALTAGVGLAWIGRGRPRA